MPDSPKDIAQLLKEKMLALRPLYLKQLRERLTMMERSLAHIYEDKGLKHDEYEELGMLAHSICGTGTTYGFPKITAKARVLDDALRAEAHPDIHAIQDMMQALMKEMRKALEPKK